MAAAAELTQEEQDLFDSMQKDEAAPAKPAGDEKVATKEAPKGDDKAKPDAKGEAKTEKMVPALAVSEARAENRALKKELDQMKELVANGDKKLQKFIDSVQKQTAAAPKFEDDPAAHLKGENEQLKKDLEEIKTRLAKQDEGAKGAESVTRHAALVSSREAAFAKEHPDYFKAADFVAQMWRDEFTEAGFDEAQVPQMVFHKSLAITNQAVQKEKDPAATIYNIAKRNGFTSEQKAEEKDKEEKKSAGESKLEQLQKGAEAAKTAGGARGPDDLTLASLAQMDDDQIDALVKDGDWWAKNVRRSPLH